MLSDCFFYSGVGLFMEVDLVPWIIFLRLNEISRLSRQDKTRLSRKLRASAICLHMYRFQCKIGSPMQVFLTRDQVSLRN